MSRAHSRELRRSVLATLIRFRGSGWATADDVVRRLHGHDGRRVAGALRTLKRLRLVEAQSVIWRDFHDAPMHDTDSLQEWRITPVGVEALADLDRCEPRLETEAAAIAAWRRRQQDREQRQAARARKHLRVVQ